MRGSVRSARNAVGIRGASGCPEAPYAVRLRESDRHGTVRGGNMAKQIAVWGTPDSGKSVLATKLALVKDFDYVLSLDLAA